MPSNRLVLAFGRGWWHLVLLLRRAPALCSSPSDWDARLERRTLFACTRTIGSCCVEITKRTRAGKCDVAEDGINHYF